MAGHAEEGVRGGRQGSGGSIAIETQCLSSDLHKEPKLSHKYIDCLKALLNSN